MNILRRNCDKLKFYSARFSKMSGQGPIESIIQNCLTKSLLPSHLEILNESYMHNVPKGDYDLSLILNYLIKTFRIRNSF